MKIKILGGESLGCRSLATYVEAGGLKIFIDPGVALAPNRYGLPPHQLEIEARDMVWSEIVDYASHSDIIIITHYHYDHHNPWDNLNEVYGDKMVFLKDFKNYINPSQIRRSHFFLHRLEEAGIDISEIKVADGNSYVFGDVKISFSEPFYHGDSPRLGYVIMVLVEYRGEKFLFTSDIEGIMYDKPLNYILSIKPSIILMDGPPTYLKRYDEEVINQSFEYIRRVCMLPSLKTLILDHHITRDKNYRDILQSKILNINYNVRNIRIVNIAEYMGLKPRFLEAYRDMLYERGELDLDIS